MRISLIIPAGGSGSRFLKSMSPKERKRIAPQAPSKLFIELGGRPLLAYAIESFQKVPEIHETILAVPKGAEAEARTLIRDQGWKHVKVTRGGKTRAESVLKGLLKTSSQYPWVMVHDGARPFVSPGAVKKVIQAARACEGAILAKKVVPTIKEVKSGRRINRTIDRTVLYEAQTPQLVKRSLLKQAYKSRKAAFQATDEASMLEAMGKTVRVVNHDGWNPKITTAQDFELAKAYLSPQSQNKNGMLRSGIGRDIHRLVDKRKLYLGGVHVPSKKGALGHSDGDVLLHAVTDAILGAAGKGDIGEWFSDKNPKFKNIRSTKILESVMKEMKKNQWSVQHVDTVVYLEKPKLGSYKQKMKNKIAQLLELSSGDVSVKAKTMEGLGPIGEEKAISCEALVTIRKDGHD